MKSSYARFDAQTLNLAFRGVLGEHAAAWRETHTGRQMWPALTVAAEGVQSLVAGKRPPVDGAAIGRGLVADLRTQDRIAGVLVHTTEAVLSDDAAPVALRGAVAKLQAELDVAGIRKARRLVDRVALAERFRVQMPQVVEALRSVATPTGETLESVLNRWLAAADGLVSLHEGAAPSPVVDERQVVRGAHEALAAARRRLENEVDLRPELSRGLVEQVFGATDQVAETLARAARRSRRAPEVAAPVLADTADVLAV